MLCVSAKNREPYEVLHRTGSSPVRTLHSATLRAASPKIPIVDKNASLLVVLVLAYDPCVGVFALFYHTVL
jgi:hypothetical protein